MPFLASALIEIMDNGPQPFQSLFCPSQLTFVAESLSLGHVARLNLTDGDDDEYKNNIFLCILLLAHVERFIRPLL